MAAMFFNPQTPQSPSQFSPSTADTSSMNSSMTAITTALPTPAHSVNGSAQPGDCFSQDTIMADSGGAHKRKRPSHDGGDQKQKKAHVEDPRRMGIENLHLDVGEKYLLCRTPYAPAQPPVTEDFFKAYDLEDIAASVARFTPSGEKNAMRKTYKGHIKKIGVNGQWDVVKTEADDDMESLLYMTRFPPSEWHVHQRMGKEIERGFSDQLQSSLLKATTMAKGTIPKGEWDSSVLGDLAAATATVSKKSNQDAAKVATPGTPISSGPSAQSKTGKPQLSQLDRARRNGKKRSYQDSSFEGYGDGFADDAETGYSTGDNDERSSKQKRRKQHHSGGGPLRQQVHGGPVGA